MIEVLPRIRRHPLHLAARVLVEVADAADVTLAGVQVDEPAARPR